MINEEKTKQIMATAKLMQDIVKDSVIRIDTIIIKPDSVILAKGTQGEDDYMELNEIMIDEKEIEKFHEECDRIRTAIKTPGDPIKLAKLIEELMTI